MKKVLLFAAAIASGMLWGKVQAQAVYKCNGDTYSQQPCSARVVRSYPAPATQQRERKEGEVIAHRLPGETSAQMAVRRRRVHLSDADRDECARLDKAIPFEFERIVRSTQPAEADDARAALGQAKKRFGKLHC
jgi:hypothetical protein